MCMFLYLYIVAPLNNCRKAQVSHQRQSAEDNAVHCLFKVQYLDFSEQFSFQDVVDSNLTYSVSSPSSISGWLPLLYRRGRT